MNKDMILKSDVLDILFDNRNKIYGAYELRKHYPVRLLHSLGITSLAAMVLCAFTFLPVKESYHGIPYTIRDPELGNPPKTLEPPVKPKAPPTAPQASPTVKPGSRISFVNKKDSVDDPDLSNLRMDIGGKTNINPVPGMTVTNDPVKPGEGTEPVKSKAPATDRTRPVYFAEVMPEFPGGNAALRDFLQKNLRSPQDLESGEEVEVRVSFVVGYDGKLQSFVTLQDGGEAFNNEVIRVLRKMPDWKPGRANGENVSVYFTLPVKFVPAE